MQDQKVNFERFPAATEPVGCLKFKIDRVYPRGFKFDIAEFIRSLIGNSIDKKSIEDAISDKSRLIAEIEKYIENDGEYQVIDTIDSYFSTLVTNPGTLEHPLTMLIEVSGNWEASITCYKELNSLQSNTNVRFKLPTADDRQRALARREYSELQTGTYTEQTKRRTTMQYCISVNNMEDTAQVVFSFNKRTTPFKEAVQSKFSTVVNYISYS